MSQFTLKNIKDSLGAQYPGVPDGELQLNVDTAEFEFTNNSGVPVDTTDHMHLMAICLYIHSLHDPQDSMRFGWRARFADCWKSASFQKKYKETTGHAPMYWFCGAPGSLNSGSTF
jgi:hypothetical protein